MNFFEQQDRSRKSTVQLVCLFGLAVITLIIMTNLLVMGVFGYINSEHIYDAGDLFHQLDWSIFAAVSAGVCAVVLLGSLYKIMALSGGGKSVAESLGGKLIPQNTQDPQQRKLLNVVEEMAIASGTPAPPVYLLDDEPGINAFAAGFSPRDAVIGITQGALDSFSRDQLQGVIAHEFSHIFNGDMRLNIRLIGVLHGILIIGIIGYHTLRSVSRSRGNKKGGGTAAIALLGLGLMVIGYAGTFFGSLIKAAVSRQREYLADASAVQFTRNPDGIGDALKLIGGHGKGSTVENAGAAEISHAFFAEGVTSFVKSLSATHPPLGKRILRIDPHWNGEFISANKIEPPDSEEDTDKQKTLERQKRARKAASVFTGATMADVSGAIDKIGNPSQETIDYARILISKLPTVIADAARDPYGARAVIYTLLLDPDQNVRDQQLKYLKSHADMDVLTSMDKLMPEMVNLHIKYRLPLIDMVIPALKQLSLHQYKSFRKILGEIIKMDAKVKLMEWSLQKILLSHLDGQFLKLSNTGMRNSSLNQLKQETVLVLSAMAYAGHKDQIKIEEAFFASINSLNFSGLQLVSKKELKVSALDLTLQKLAKLKPLDKQRLLKACAECVVHDQKISSIEIEMLRTFSDALDCPMPPIPSL
jgi:Zn-dependent protease with chaperone function